MKLGMEVGFGPGHLVLDGDPAPLPPLKGAQQSPPLFSPCLMWPNGRPSQLLLSSLLDKVRQLCLLAEWWMWRTFIRSQLGAQEMRRSSGWFSLVSIPVIPKGSVFGIPGTNAESPQRKTLEEKVS